MLPTKIKSAFGTLQPYVHLNFITLHYIYYIAICLVSAIIFWGSSTPARSVPFIDSLFLTVSAMTQAGLNTVNLSEINTWQQVILFILMLIGSAVLISCAVVHTRKVAFEKRFASAIAKERRHRKAMKSNVSFSRSMSRRRTPINDTQAPSADGMVGRGQSIRSELDLGPNTEKDDSIEAHLPSEQGFGVSAVDAPKDHTDHTILQEDKSYGSTNYSGQRPKPVPPPIREAIQRIKFAGAQNGNNTSSCRVQESPTVLHHDHPRFHLRSPRTPWRASRDENEASEDHRVSMGSTRREVHRSTSEYFDSDGIIGRNSQFYSLSTPERENLGGVEYRAVVLLEHIIVAYFVLLQLLGCIGLGAWISHNAAPTTLANGLNPWWTGVFLGVSAFNNNGMNLLDASKSVALCLVHLLIRNSLRYGSSPVIRLRLDDRGFPHSSWKYELSNLFAPYIMVVVQASTGERLFSRVPADLSLPFGSPTAMLHYIVPLNPYLVASREPVCLKRN
jgi:Cation transport protein